MKKVYKIIISALSFAILIGIIFMIKENIDVVKIQVYRINETSDQLLISVYNKYMFQYTIFIIINVITILLIGFFNFLLWFKQVFCCIPLTAAEKADRKKIIQENKKLKLQEKLNKLD